jgi:hypothetical protein
MEDLNDRIKFLDRLAAEVRPKVVWLSALFHPEEYLTAILQIYAKQYSVPFDS